MTVLQEKITYQLPEGPKSPGFWQILRWIGDPLQFEADCASKYGDTFTITLNLGVLQKMVILGNPQDIKDIFSKDGNCFDIGRANKIAEPLFGPKSLVLLDGQAHKRKRKLLMPPFHGERLTHYSKLICELAQTVGSQWQVGKPFIARQAMQQISLEVIVQVVFGLREGERYEKLKPLLTELLDLTDSPVSSSLFFLKFLQKDWGAWTPWGTFKRYRQQICELLQAEIEERRGKSETTGEDILSLMMSARYEDGNLMNDEELQDELITLLFAGHETTATILAWALYQLHRNLAVKDKLVAEIASLGENPDPMAVARLPYLTAVSQEILRMYPVIPIIFPRIPKQPLKIGKYHYDAETLLCPSIYLVHYREELYPNPHQFRPERFLERQYAPHEFLPFGGGNRRCLGYALAQLEIKLVLATILSHHQLSLVNDTPVKPQRRGFAISPQGGVPLVKIAHEG